jgi:hypothetical protein
VTARAQAAAPAEVAAPAQPGYAWSPNPVTLPGQRPNPVLAQLGPVGKAIVRLALFPRNEFLYHRFDLKPKATPFTAPETPDATALNGTLNAYTQFGGPISVAVITAPTNGTVTVTDDGFFTYTPDEALAGIPGADTFTAKVTDVSYHFGKVIGKIFGIPDRSTTVDIPISWNNLAPPPPGDSNEYTYAIYNYTGYTLQVSSWGDQQATTSAPPVGTVVNQGEAVYVTMVGSATKDKESTYYFDAIGAGVAGIGPDNPTYPDYKANTKLNYNYNGVYYYDQATSCAAYSGSCDNGSKSIYLYDSPGTNFYLPGTTAQDIDTQNNVINQFVADDGSNVAFLNPTSSIGYTPLTAVSGVAVLNCPAKTTCYLDITQTDSVSRTAGHSDTVGVSVTLGTGQESAVNFQAEASYERAWNKSVTTESTTSQSYTEQFPAYGVRAYDYGFELYTFQTSPVVYTSGTTTVTQFNDTYNLQDTWYTFPNYDPPLSSPPYINWYQCPTNGAACKSMSAGVVPAGFNFFTDISNPEDPGYQDCSTDCDVYYGTADPGEDVKIDSVTGFTVWAPLDDFPTYYLTNPVGAQTVTPGSTQG